MLTIINKIAPIIVKITTVVDKSTLGLTKNCTPDRLVINPNKTNLIKQHKQTSSLLM